jgi:hypothetical protein
MKPTAFGILSAYLVSTLLAGCSVNARWTYPLKPPIKVVDPNPPDIKIAALPARDLRGAKNVAVTQVLFLIPLMPFGWIEHQRPEAAREFMSIREFDGNLVEDIPKAIAQHWREAGISKQVFFDYGLLADQADFTLHTTLNKTTYYGRITSYGLSFFGVYLWIFGAPAGSHKVILDIDLELRDKAGNTAWKGKVKRDYFEWVGLFYGQGSDMDGLALGLQKGLDEIAKEIAESRAKLVQQRKETIQPKSRYYPPR